jgi:hypothetical protein
VVAGGGGAVAWGSPEKKLGMGGLQGWPGRRRTGGGELFRGSEAALGPAVRPVVAGGSGGVQVEDELQALPKLHVKCLSATIAFSFDSNIQIPQ